MASNKGFKAITLTLCMVLLVGLVPSMAFAETESMQTQNAQQIQEEYQVVDGQAVKVMHRNTETTGQGKAVELDGYTRYVANCSEDEIVVNGNSVISITTEGDEPGVQPRSRTRQSIPAYGSAKDYTVKVGTVTKNIEFEKAICKLAVSAVFTGIGIYLPAAFSVYSYVAEKIIDAAIDGCRDSKISVLKETTYRTKDMGALYNKFNQEWYVKKSDGSLKHASSSVCYDYFW